jgi:hypothetical protein
MSKRWACSRSSFFGLGFHRVIPRTALTTAVATAMAATLATAMAAAVASAIGGDQGHVRNGRVGAMRTLNQAGVESLRRNAGGC